MSQQGAEMGLMSPSTLKIKALVLKKITHFVFWNFSMKILPLVGVFRKDKNS